MQVFYFADFGENPPAGVLGGGAGSTASAAKLEVGGSETPRPTIGDVELQVGEWVKGCESGGGGYGDPAERDPAAVHADIHAGYISESHARLHYPHAFEE